MDTLKELAVDALVLVLAWFLVTASGISKTASGGLTCGRAEEVTQAHP